MLASSTMSTMLGTHGGKVYEGDSNDGDGAGGAWARIRSGLIWLLIKEFISNAGDLISKVSCTQLSVEEEAEAAGDVKEVATVATCRFNQSISSSAFNFLPLARSLLFTIELHTIFSVNPSLKGNLPVFYTFLFHRILLCCRYSHSYRILLRYFRTWPPPSSPVPSSASTASSAVVDTVGKCGLGSRGKQLAKLPEFSKSATVAIMSCLVFRYFRVLVLIADCWRIRNCARLALSLVFFKYSHYSF